MLVSGRVKIETWSIQRIHNFEIKLVSRETRRDETRQIWFPPFFQKSHFYWDSFQDCLLKILSKNPFSIHRLNFVHSKHHRIFPLNLHQQTTPTCIWTPLTNVWTFGRRWKFYKGWPLWKNIPKSPMIENWDVGVSKNRCTPKSSIFMGFSIINHPFWDTPIFGNTHVLWWGRRRQSCSLGVVSSSCSFGSWSIKNIWL